MKIGLFYGSSTCYTEMAAEKIRDILGDDLVELHDVKETDLQLMESYPGADPRHSDLGFR